MGRVRSLPCLLNDCLSADAIYTGQQEREPTIRERSIPGRLDLRTDCSSAPHFTVALSRDRAGSCVIAGGYDHCPVTSNNTLPGTSFVCFLSSHPFITIQCKLGKVESWFLMWNLSRPTCWEAMCLGPSVLLRELWNYHISNTQRPSQWNLSCPQDESLTLNLKRLRALPLQTLKL